MTIELYIPKVIHHRANSIQKFMQQMINRLAVGQIRYGEPNKIQNYLTRITLELKHYKRTGNSESLRNIANYCWLENEAPENKKFHYNDKADSATRSLLP